MVSMSNVEKTECTDCRLTPGSPNAQAFSYLLLQHKAELGNLQITKIRVFHDDRDLPGPNMVLFVEPVPADYTIDPPDQHQDGSMSNPVSVHANHSNPTANNATVDPAIDTTPGRGNSQPVMVVEKVWADGDGEIDVGSQIYVGDVGTVQRRPRRRRWGRVKL